MRNRSQCVFAGLTAALVIALAVASASAQRLSVSSQGFRIHWSRLTFSEAGGGFPVSCPVTLEGSFHSRSMAKVEQSLVAYITRAIVSNSLCQEGHATILTSTLPWHVLYQSFTGRLPAITSVRHLLVGAGFQLELGLGIVCLAQTTRESPASGTANREAGGNVISLEADPELTIPVRGSPVCPPAGIFSGSGEVHALGSNTTRVRMTLI